MRPRREAKPPRRPRVLTWRLVIVSLVVGVVLAVVSVPVGAVAGRVHQAWQSGWPPPDWQGEIDRRDHVVFIARYEWIGWTMTGSELVPTPLNPAWEDSRSRWIEPREDPRPPFARTGLAGREGSVYHFSAGWPTAAAAGREVIEPATGLRRERLALITVRGQFVRLPLRPIWLGLGANALFFALLVLVLTCLLRARRIRRRAGRGLCLACGYELGEGVDACPECGLARAGA
ncbi:MAG: hypothetical protein RIE32_09680 [Phycisphaerales bacterium]